MSSPQLDILALEPFYGGVRRSMLETLVRCSRHRWTVLKLPPRRLERRLSVAANWFAEQLTRHWVGRVDLLFTSEAMNLSSLYRLMPALAKKPAVVYFHDNQLPDVMTSADAPLDLVNLNTAAAATQLWFNSRYHQQTFTARAAALVERHPELSGRSPLAELARKASLVPPPIDMSAVQDARCQQYPRDGNALFVETRDADVGLLNAALRLLRDGGERDLRLITVGPADQLTPDVDRQTLPEADEAAHARGLCEAGVILSVRPEAASDFSVVRGLAAGCRPVLPASGVYPELLPPSLQRSSLYDVAPQALADKLRDALSPFQEAPREAELRRTLKPFDAIPACREMDERFEELVWVREVN